MDIRIGLGVDYHILVVGRKFILGGIEIPHTKGALGHSDADVLLHAICDALLGALALGDIGKHFPDTDDNYKDIDSQILLRKTYELVKSRGFQLQNLDSTVLLQKPKIAPHIDDIRKNIAQLLEVRLDTVSVKASTTEKMDAVGKEEGVIAHAVCLLAKI